MSYDWKLTEDGDLDETGILITGDEAVAQALRIALSTHVGEWPFDVTAGLPWATWSEFAPAPIGAIDARLRAEIENVRGVAQVRSGGVSLNTQNGQVEAEYVVTLLSQGRLQVNVTLDPIVVSNNPALAVGVTPFGALSTRA